MRQGSPFQYSLKRTIQRNRIREENWKDKNKNGSQVIMKSDEMLHIKDSKDSTRKLLELWTLPAKCQDIKLTLKFGSLCMSE